MTNSEILEMAREAGMLLPSGKYFEEREEAIVRFVKLVVQRDREHCAATRLGIALAAVDMEKEM